MVLEGASFCVTENKTKGNADFENRARVSKDAFQLLAEGGRTDRKLYQSCKRFWRLKRVRICGQCCRYVWVMFPSLAGTRLTGMRIGSGCQLAAAFSALAVEAGSEAVLELAWSDLLDLFADGASVVF